MSDDLELILDLKEAKKEITALRERLEQAERERDGWKEVATKTNHLAEDLARRAGFRAGIEAAAHLIECDGDALVGKSGAAKAIRALSPTDMTPSVAEVTKPMIEAAFKKLPADAWGTIAEGEMERILEAALAAQTGEPQ